MTKGTLTGDHRTMELQGLISELRGPGHWFQNRNILEEGDPIHNYVKTSSRNWNTLKHMVTTLKTQRHLTCSGSPVLMGHMLLEMQQISYCIWSSQQLREVVFLISLISKETDSERSKILLSASKQNFQRTYYLLFSSVPDGKGLWAMLGQRYSNRACWIKSRAQEVMSIYVVHKSFKIQQKLYS